MCQNPLARLPKQREYHDPMTDSDLAKLATLYYIDGCTQDELSKTFVISRATVGRMLRKAQKEGIVEIRVRPHATIVSDLEKQLMERFGIQRALIAIDHSDVDKQRELLAGLVAGELDRILIDGSIVAVGMGRNLSSVSEHAMSTTRRQCTFVSAIGGSYRGGQTMNADHIARRLAARFGGESESLYAPALVNDSMVRLALLQNDTVRHTLDKARQADIALIGIGDLSEDSNMVRMGWFTAAEISEAKRQGTVGDMMGYDFIDINGRPAMTPIQGRVIGLGHRDLQQIPNVIAVAAESSKVKATLGALRTRTIKTLATTTNNAIAVLHLDELIRKIDN